MSNLPPLDPLRQDEILELFTEALREEERDLLSSLGEGLINECAPEGTRVTFSSGIPSQVGIKLWAAFESELYELFCDSDSKCPKAWVDELIQGDTRNLILGIVAAITSHYDVGLGIAVPAGALAAKKGLTSFCNRSIAQKPRQSVAAILADQRKAEEDFERFLADMDDQE